MKTEKSAESVESYMRGQPTAIRKRLNEVRAIVRSLAPLATERISYRMPAFFLNGNLIYFAAFKNHIGFYPGANGIAAFQDEIARFKSAKGSIQFPHDQPLPTALVKRLVKYKVMVNSEKRRKG